MPASAVAFAFALLFAAGPDPLADPPADRLSQVLVNQARQQQQLDQITAQQVAILARLDRLPIDYVPRSEQAAQDLPGRLAKIEASVEMIRRSQEDQMMSLIKWLVSVLTAAVIGAGGHRLYQYRSAAGPPPGPRVDALSTPARPEGVKP